MTHSNVSCGEPELPELAQLRELSRMEAASGRMRERVLARAQATLFGAAAGQTRVKRHRALLLAALALIGVPSAFAATPLGQRHLGAWLGVESPAPVPRRVAPAAVAQAQPKLVSPAAIAAPAQRQPVVEPPSASDERPNEPVAPSQAYRKQPIGSPSPDGAVRAKAKAPVRAFPLEAPTSSPSNSPEAITSLAEESRLLRQARLSLAARDADAALRIAEAHRRRFPGGVLRQERLEIEQQAWALRSSAGAR